MKKYKILGLLAASVLVTGCNIDLYDDVPPQHVHVIRHRVYHPIHNPYLVPRRNPVVVVDRHNVNDNPRHFVPRRDPVVVVDRHNVNDNPRRRVIVTNRDEHPRGPSVVVVRHR